MLDSLPKKEVEVDAPLDINSFKVDPENFVPLDMVDRGFDVGLRDELILDGKGKKVGKVLASAHNLGVALVDLTRLKANKQSKDFSIDGHRCLLWQPVWLRADLDNAEEQSPAQ